MKTALLKKFFSLILTVMVVTVAVFLIIHLIPGDPAQMVLGRSATHEQLEAMRERMNLNAPLLDQYMTWAANLLKGDMGTSLTNGLAVAGQIGDRFPRTLMLCLIAMAVSLLIAVPLGVVTAAKHNTKFDLFISGGSVLVLSIPEFWFGILLMIVFSVWLGILPAGGYVKPADHFGNFLKSMILPVVTLAMCLAPQAMRMIRGSMLEVLNEDYITLAKTKGNSPWRVHFIHALRNSLIPISTALCVQIASLMAGVIVIERTFQFPGMGFLLLGSIERRDYPMIQGCLLMFALVVVLVNFLSDLLYTVIDPRIRLN